VGGWGGGGRGVCIQAKLVNIYKNKKFCPDPMAILSN